MPPFVFSMVRTDSSSDAAALISYEGIEKWNVLMWDVCLRCSCSLKAAADEIFCLQVKVTVVKYIFTDSSGT